MKYIKLFESFMSLEDIKEQIKGSLYEIEDLGIEVLVHTSSYPSFKDATKAIEETQINLQVDDNSKVTTFLLTIEMIESIQVLLNWLSKEHHFDHSIYILPEFDNRRSIRRLSKNELIEYKDINIFGLELKSQRII